MVENVPGDHGWVQKHSGRNAGINKDKECGSRRHAISEVPFYLFLGNCVSVF